MRQVRHERAHRTDETDHQDDDSCGHEHGADAPSDAARQRIDQRERPAERATDRLAQENDHGESQHAEPQVAVVIKRKIAIAEVAVGRQVEQQQPSEARGQHQTRIAQARRDRLRSRRKALLQPHRGNQSEPRGAQ